MSLKIISTFGDHTSLYPLAVKDVVNSLGVTAFSYDAGGKIEAKDRFIDEFGTQAIWLGGLPFFKWAFNKTAYKAAGLNPDVDIRLIRDKDQFEVASKYAKEYANKLKNQGASLIDDLTKAQKSSKIFKNLFFGKFAAATALTLGSFFTLVKLKQNYTKKQVEAEFWQKKAKEGFYKQNNKSTAFKGFLGMSGNDNGKPVTKDGGLKNKKSPSFGSAASFAQSFMFDPVKNLFIVDAGITGERLASSRTKTEFWEYAIKEGGFLFFMYIAGRYVQSGIEYLSEKIFKKPIDLHAEFISSDELKNSITSGKVKTDIEAFEKAAQSNKSMYEFIYSTADNVVVQAAKKSGMLSTLKNAAKEDTGLINPHQFIDPDKMKKLANDIKKLVESCKNSGEKLETFLKKSSKLKVGSVISNLAVSCLFLGFVIPKLMIVYREKNNNGKKDFHVQREIQQTLENNFKARQMKA